MLRLMRGVERVYRPLVCALFLLFGFLAPAHASPPLVSPPAEVLPAAPDIQAEPTIRIYLISNRAHGPPVGVLFLRVNNRGIPSAAAVLYAYCGGDPINRADPSGLDWVDVNDNGDVIWQIEEDGFWANYNKRTVVIGRLNGGMVDISQQFGGGQASFGGLQDIASKFWREYSDISASPVGVQNAAIGGAIDRVRGGGSITASSAAWEYSAAAAQGVGQGTVNTARAIVEPVTATVDTATNSVAAATGWNVSTQMSYTFEEGGLLDRVDAIQGTLERNGETGVWAYYTAGFYGSADLIGVADLSDAAIGDEVVFGQQELLGLNDLSLGDRALKTVSGGAKLAATASFTGGGLRGYSAIRSQGVRGWSRSALANTKAWTRNAWGSTRTGLTQTGIASRGAFRLLTSVRSVQNLFKAYGANANVVGRRFIELYNSAGERIFSIERHNFGSNPNPRLHLHLGASKSQLKKHRPWDGGWRGIWDQLIRLGQ